MAVSSSFGTDEIVHLNVGGTRFSTSKQTLTWVPDSFFTGLLSNRIASHKDEQGAIFIDRDPSLFSIVLNYLRTKHVNLSNVDIHSLKHEAEYYGITPLVKRLMLCEDLSHSTCGDILFIEYLKPPNVPPQESCSTSESSTDTPAEVSPSADPLKVQIIRADQDFIVVAYAHFVTCYRRNYASGLEHIFTSSRVDSTIERVTISTQYSPKYTATAGIDIAFSYGSQVRLWSLDTDGVRKRPVDHFDLNARVEYLFFIGNQLVALSSMGAIGVRHAMTRHWQRQNVVPSLSFETAGSLLLLGCNNGSIYYIDMEKFPLRMKDNDLLVTELYRDPNREPITAISVYLTAKTSGCGIWVEIAYGTKSGTVRIVTQHPETGVYAPQLFQSFTAHQSSVSKVSLSNRYLVSVCSDYNHVKSWAMTRCAGMLSLHPDPSPNASFKLVSLEAIESCASYNAGNDYGPYGEQDDEQVFIQKVVPETDQLHVRLASNGNRVCVIKSVNNSVISSFFVHELQHPSELRASAKRVILTGHSNGTVQMWDLTTALQSWYSATQDVQSGPTPEELWRFLDQCDLSNSHCSTPCISPSPSLASAMPVSHPSNILALNQSQSNEPTARRCRK